MKLKDKTTIVTGGGTGVGKCVAQTFVQEGAKVVSTSVLAGAAYSASKHAMTAYTKTISLEEKDNGIRATAIHPGEINTPILDRRPAPPPQAAREVMLQPEDVAVACLFVATLHPRANRAIAYFGQQGLKSQPDTGSLLKTGY